jgi:transcriptional regulator with XRE-family HTH domain
MPAIPPHTTPANTEVSWDGPEARLAVTNVPASDKPGIEAHLRKQREDAGLEENMSQEEAHEACGENSRWLQSVLLQESIDDAIALHEVQELNFSGDIVPLSEGKIRRDGTIALKIIGQQWGTSGYYSKDTLERDLPQVFPLGTHMYWNHPTVTERIERPERDLNELAAVFVREPTWQENGPKGPGMYVDAKVFGGYAKAIEEIGDHIGISINAIGKKETGVAEGRKGPIVTSITAGQSVDFVTKAGAGGGIVSLFESAPLFEQSRLGDFLRRRRDELELSNEDLARAAGVDVSTMGSILSGEIVRPPDARLRRLADLLDTTLETLLRLVPSERREPEEVSQGTAPREAAKTGSIDPDGSGDIPLMEVDKVMEKELQEAQEQLAEKDDTIAKLQEMLLLREVGDFVASALAKAELPDVTKIRLQRQLVKNPPVDGGRLDEAAYGEMVETAIKEASVEVATILGRDVAYKWSANG